MLVSICVSLILAGSPQQQKPAAEPEIESVGEIGKRSGYETLPPASMIPSVPEYTENKMQVLIEKQEKQEVAPDSSSSRRGWLVGAGGEIDISDSSNQVGRALGVSAAQRFGWVILEGQVLMTRPLGTRLRAQRTVLNFADAGLFIQGGITAFWSGFGFGPAEFSPGFSVGGGVRAALSGSVGFVVDANWERLFNTPIYLRNSLSTLSAKIVYDFSE